MLPTFPEVVDQTQTLQQTQSGAVSVYVCPLSLHHADHLWYAAAPWLRMSCLGRDKKTPARIMVKDSTLCSFSGEAQRAIWFQNKLIVNWIFYNLLCFFFYEYKKYEWNMMDAAAAAKEINKYLNEGSQTSTDVMNRKELIVIRCNWKKTQGVNLESRFLLLLLLLHKLLF